MALPALEPFTGGAAALSGSWTQCYAGQTVNKNGSGVGTGNAGGMSTDAFAFWNADVFNNDQYAQVVVKTVSSGANYAEAITRVSGSEGTTNAYQGYTDGVTGAAHTEVAKYVANVQTVLRNFATTFAANDVIRLEASGTTLTLYKNGVSLGTQVDAAIASGSAGVGDFNLATFDDWEGGNLAAGPSADQNTYTPWFSESEWRGGNAGGSHSMAISLQRGERG